MPDITDLEREIHLWILPTARFDELNLEVRAAGVLSEEEQLRASRFRFDNGRRSYIAAHWLVRRALSEYVPIPPSAWMFEHTLLGKPSIASPAKAKGLRFNLSHCSGMVACGVTTAGEVGVDVEALHARDYLRLARRYFAPEEISQLESLANEQQPRAFFRLWTLKEAYIKAKGLGLSTNLAGFAFPNIMNEAIAIQFHGETDDRPANWCFHRHEPDEDHIIAVALECFADRKPVLRVLSGE